MKKKMYIAQKALCFDKTRTKILVNKYLDAKYTADKVKGKYGIPGGKTDFGETPKESLVREVKEETGITIFPVLPFQTWTWTYKKKSEKIQIVANAWLAFYKSGKIKKPNNEQEVKLAVAEWVKFKEIDSSDFIHDERGVLTDFVNYQKKNPFILKK